MKYVVSLVQMQTMKHNKQNLFNKKCNCNAAIIIYKKGIPKGEEKQKPCNRQLFFFSI